MTPSSGYVQFYLHTKPVLVVTPLQLLDLRLLPRFGRGFRSSRMLRGVGCQLLHTAVSQKAKRCTSPPYCDFKLYQSVTFKKAAFLYRLPRHKTFHGVINTNMFASLSSCGVCHVITDRRKLKYMMFWWPSIAQSLYQISLKSVIWFNSLKRRHAHP